MVVWSGSIGRPGARGLNTARQTIRSELGDCNLRFTNNNNDDRLGRRMETPSHYYYWRVVLLEMWIGMRI